MRDLVPPFSCALSWSIVACAGARDGHGDDGIGETSSGIAQGDDAATTSGLDPGTSTSTSTGESPGDETADGESTGGVVKSCADLPAPGTWENIAPPDTAWTDAIVVDPFDPTVVWVGGQNRGIFKSTDCGASWLHVNAGQNGAAIDSGDPVSIAVDPITPGVIYTTAAMGSSGLWKSTNGGVDWTPLFPPESEVAQVVEYNLINSIGMDPHDSNHLVVSTHALCAGEYGPVCEAETLDGGDTWVITRVPIPDAQGWVAGAGAFILGPSSWLFATYSLGLWLTEDHGATWTDVTPAGASGSTSGKTIILPFYPSDTGNYYLAAMEGILQSVDGRSWTLLPGSGGRSVGLAMGGGRLYSADQWSAIYRTADESDLSNWTDIAPPAELPADQGAPYLAYDSAHHILYSSNWAGGLWRIVTP